MDPLLLDLAGNRYANVQLGAGRQAAGSGFSCSIQGAGIRCLAGGNHGRISAVPFAAGDVSHVTGDLSPQSR